MARRVAQLHTALLCTLSQRCRRTWTASSFANLHKDHECDPAVLRRSQTAAMREACLKLCERLRAEVPAYLSSLGRLPVGTCLA